MTAAGLAVRYLASRPLLNLLTAFSIAVGVALVIATAALSVAAQKSTRETAGGYQLLVAAKGSPAQAVLSTLFFIEPPTGNIPIEVYDQLRTDPGAALLVPFNFGDSYRGRFIVGTTGDYRGVIEAATSRAPITEPLNRWAAQPFEAVVGATAARETGLKLGDAFIAAHGFVELPEDLSERHEQQAYRVVAMLQRTNTPADRVIFTPLESTWITHGETHPAGAAEERDDERRQGQAREHPVRGSHITALLIHGRGYADVARFAAVLGQRRDVQAIFPGRVATQIMSYMRSGQSVVLALAWLSIGIACIAVMISLLAAAIDRRRQIATLRAIGAPRRVVFGVLLGEAAIICVLGSLAGILLGRVGATIIAWRIEETSGFHIDLLPLGVTELATVAVAVALGLAAAALPAYLACREDVARNLAPVT
jgi:putative ABC transport system permease protein